MKFKVGDKVKFLDEKGGGIVSKIISSKIVNVAIEDGFEIPTLTSNLIKIEAENKTDKLFDESYNVDIESTVKENIPEDDYETRTSPLLKYSSVIKTPSGIYLAFAPHNQNLLIAGLLDIYLINHTEYDVMFSLFLKEQSGYFSGIDYDVVPSEQKLLLNTIERDKLEEWSQGVIQILFHKDKNASLLLPANSNFKIKPTKFYKEDNYKAYSFIEDKAFLVSIIKLSDQILLSKGKFSEEIEKKFNKKQTTYTKAKELKIESIIDKHKISPGQAEVDLHISALRDNYSDLSSGEILNIQINYFTKCLKSAIENNFRKVIFIHGIGNGTLKTAIKEILKGYEETEYNDASYAKYGMGAIEVIIHNLT